MINDMVFSISRWGSNDEKISMAFRQLALMLAAEVPAIEALNTLIDEAGDKKTKRVITALKADSLNEKKTKSSGIKYPDYYNQALIYLLNKEENKRFTAEFLYHIADDLQKRGGIKGKIQSVLLYPAITFSIAMVILTVILVFVIPVFQLMYQDFGKDLPAATCFVIDLSRFFRDHMVGIIIGAFMTFSIAGKFKRQIMALAFYSPVLGTVLRNLSVFQFSRCLAVMLKGGIPLHEAVIYSARAVDNLSFSKRTRQMGESLVRESRLKPAMEKTRLFPKAVIQAVAAGEKAEALYPVFEQVAKYYETASDMSLKMLTVFIDVSMILFIGTVVGGIVVAMYLPVFQMAGAIS